MLNLCKFVEDISESYDLYLYIQNKTWVRMSAMMNKISYHGQTIDSSECPLLVVDIDA